MGEKSTVKNYRLYRNKTHAAGSFDDSKETGESAELLALM